MTRFQYETPAGTQIVEFDYDPASGSLNLGGQVYPCDGSTITVEGHRLAFAVHRRDDTVEVSLDGTVYRFETLDLRRRSSEHLQSGPSSGQLTAEMPGKVLSIAVVEGEEVSSGQTLLVMESMKMELALQAPFAAMVEGVSVEAEQMVAQGDLLLALSPIEASEGVSS